ncbi:MAG: hypothetical protein P8Q92_09710 [Pseudoprimorskyibacter sp.]|nr:hypothetical protein [Pseudoprimorskyibacter sp.]
MPGCRYEERSRSQPTCRSARTYNNYWQGHKDQRGRFRTASPDLRGHFQFYFGADPADGPDGLVFVIKPEPFRRLIFARHTAQRFHKPHQGRSRRTKFMINVGHEIPTDLIRGLYVRVILKRRQNPAALSWTGPTPKRSVASCRLASVRYCPLFDVASLNPALLASGASG